MRQQSGIYGIIHTASNRIYIGSAVHLPKRWQSHLSKLRNGTHENSYLQYAWIKHGEDAFTWVILELVRDVTELLQFEQKWIDHYQAYERDKGFNICPTAGSPLGHRFTQEQRQQQSIRQKLMARKQSEYQKQAVSQALQGNKHGAGKHYHGVLTEQDIVDIFKALASGTRTRELVSRFNVSAATITRIARRKIWYQVPIPDEIVIAAQHRIKTARQGAGKAILTEADIPVIRQRLANNESGSSIARDYGVSPVTISCIKLGKNWTHVI